MKHSSCNPNPVLSGARAWGQSVGQVVLSQAEPSVLSHLGAGSLTAWQHGVVHVCIVGMLGHRYVLGSPTHWEVKVPMWAGNCPTPPQPWGWLLSQPGQGGVMGAKVGKPRQGMGSSNAMAGWVAGPSPKYLETQPCWEYWQPACRPGQALGLSCPVPRSRNGEGKGAGRLGGRKAGPYWQWWWYTGTGIYRSSHPGSPSKGRSVPQA